MGIRVIVKDKNKQVKNDGRKVCIKRVELIEELYVNYHVINP